MGKLEDATKLQLCVSEERLKSLEIANNEPLKLLHESKEVILKSSQEEVEGLNSQLQFLRFVNQNKMSLGELQEAFEEQISVMEKHWESIHNRKEQVEEVLNSIIKIESHLLDNLHGETQTTKSYHEFLRMGYQVITEEKTAHELRRLKIAALDLSINALQKDRSVLVTKKEKLDEDLKEKSKLETLLRQSRRTLEEEAGQSECGNILNEDVLNRVDDRIEDESKPVEDQILVDLIRNDKSKDDFRPGSVAQVIHIEDDTTEVSCYSGEGEEVVSSRVSRIRNNIMAKGTRKQAQHLRTKCNQKQLYNFLSKLTGEKRRIIENSIFKPFLSIPERNICLPFLHAFIERYDVKSNSFTIDKKDMQFCGKEVEACLGLKYEGKKVDFTTRVKRPPQIFEDYFGNQGKVTNDELMEKLKKMHVTKENAVDFFKLSVYFMFSVYFFSTTDEYVSHWPVRYLEDLVGFRTFGWGRAVHEYLMESVRKTANEFQEKVSSSTHLKGCLPLLEALVYDRVGSCYLRVEVDPRVSNPSIIKYAKGDSRILTTMRKVFAKIKFDKTIEEVLVEIKKRKSNSGGDVSASGFESVEQLPDDEDFYPEDFVGDKEEEHRGRFSEGDKKQGHKKGHITYGYHMFRGKMPYDMEDYVVAKNGNFGGKQLGLYAIFDGHSGHQVAKFLQHNLFNNILSQPGFSEEPEAAVKRAYKETDEEILHKVTGSLGGSTAVTAILINREKHIVANVGDSRGILGKKQQRMNMIESGNIPRIDGVLAMSRAFGDGRLKEHISSEPDVRIEAMGADANFIVLASDGLWKVISNEEASKCIRELDNAQAAAEELVKEAKLCSMIDMYHVRCCRLHGMTLRPF